MSNDIKINNLTTLFKENILTQDKMPGLKDCAEVELKRICDYYNQNIEQLNNEHDQKIKRWAAQYSHSNNPYYPNTQGSSGLAHSLNPTRYLGMEFNYIFHRSQAEIDFHKALIDKNREIQSTKGLGYTFIFQMNAVFIAANRKRIELDCLIRWQGQEIGIEIDGDSHTNKTHFDEEKRLELIRENFLDVRRIICDTRESGWADQEVDKIFNYLNRKRLSR